MVKIVVYDLLVLAAVGTLGCGSPYESEPSPPYYGIHPAPFNEIPMGERDFYVFSYRPDGLFGAEVPCDAITWTVSDPNVLDLVIDAPNAISITALELGTSTLTVNAVCPPPAGSLSDTATIHVVPPFDDP